MKTSVPSLRLSQVSCSFHAICFVLSASSLLTLCHWSLATLFHSLLPFLLKSFFTQASCFFPLFSLPPFLNSCVAELFTLLSVYNPGPHLPSLLLHPILPAPQPHSDCFVTSIRYHVAVSYGSLQYSLLFLTILLKIKLTGVLFGFLNKTPILSDKLQVFIMDGHIANMHHVFGHC